MHVPYFDHLRYVSVRNKKIKFMLDEVRIKPFVYSPSVLISLYKLL